MYINIIMNTKKYIKRELESLIQETIKGFSVVALTGARQVGKSTLLKNLLDSKKYRFVSFDDTLLRQQALRDPKLFLETFNEYVVFDEIQYVPELFPYIKTIVDSDRTKKGRFILTGSQQFHLIKNLTETLAGRVGILNLYPFNLLEKQNTILNIKSPKSNFISACINGSYPEPIVEPNINSKIWYSSYIQMYLEKDVKSIYDIGSLRDFEQFLQLLASRISQALNLSSISRDLGISVPTLRRWISILEASQIIYLLPPYYENLGKRIYKNPKLYFLDIGLACYLLGLDQEIHIMQGPMAGPLFENFIIQETIKITSTSANPLRLFYLRTQNNLEIDLIIQYNMQLFPFEIKLSKTPNSSMAKQIERAINIFDKLPIQKGHILSLSDQEIFLTKNVSILNLFKFFQNIKTRQI